MTPVSNLLEARRALHASEDAERHGHYGESVALALHAIKHMYAWTLDVARAEVEESIAVRNVIERAENG